MRVVLLQLGTSFRFGISCNRATIILINILGAVQVSVCVVMQGISKIQLRDEDVMMILETLEFDGRVDRIDNDDGDSFRQAMLAIPQTSAFTSIPCGVCPVSLPPHSTYSLQQ